MAIRIDLCRQNEGLAHTDETPILQISQFSQACSIPSIAAESKGITAFFSAIPKLRHRQGPIFSGRQFLRLLPRMSMQSKLQSDLGESPMIEDTVKTGEIEDESLSDDQLKEVSGGVDFDQLRRENLEKDASRLDEIRRENLEKD
ncbi:MAG TPA: hypothetical protein VEZ50_18000 [Nodosilinea sp.]|jgi:hypothetical protein|nr:hypothetical protein [Nodosilinea sp.]